jgi:hypothetical protein
MGNRKAATDELIRLLNLMLPDSPNNELYRTQLERLSNEEFEIYMSKLESGEEIVSIISPNLTEQKLTVENNLKVAKELGHEFFQQLWLTDPTTQRVYLTPQKYLVIDLPVRRQQQLLVKKIAIPQHNRSSDDLTGQPTGDSRGSSLSFPELQVLYAQSLNRTTEELIKFRGGDLKAMRMMTQQLIETGAANQDSIKRTPTKVKSTETLSTFLKGMHLENTL